MDILSSHCVCFLFAHPDDDSLIAGTMRTLMAAGKEVHGVWIACDRLYGRLGNRLKELKNAVGILGLPPERTHVLKFRDLGILTQLDDAADTIAALLSSIRPDVITATAFEGGHPDHDAVNFLAYEAVYRASLPALLCEFPLYNGSGPFLHWRWRINDFPESAEQVLHVPLNEDAIRCKHAIMRAYWSQWMYMVPAWLACPPAKMALPGEPYRACPPDRDHTLPPHKGLLNYERWFCRWMGVCFDDYRRAVWAASRRL